MLGADGKLCKRGDAFVGQCLVAFGFGKFDQLDGAGQLVLDAAGGGDRFIELAPLAHQFLRGLRIVPQRRVFGAVVQLV